MGYFIQNADLIVPIFSLAYGAYLDDNTLGTILLILSIIQITLKVVTAIAKLLKGEASTNDTIKAIEDVKEDLIESGKESIDD